MDISIKYSQKYFVLIIFLLLITSFLFSETYISPDQLRKTEKELLILANRERTAKGAEPLEFNRSLYQIAMAHNFKMASENKLEHNFEGYLNLEERLVKKGIYFTAAGENIAFSNVYPSDFIHAGFVKSLLHYENIIDPKFRQAGIAVLETEKGFYITQEFGDLIFDISAVKAEERISKFIFKNSIFPDQNMSLKIKEKYGEELKRISAILLKEGRYSKQNEQLEGFDILTMQAGKLEQIEEYIMSSNSEHRYGSYGFAITSGRTRKFRGGVFSFVLALKEKLREYSMSEEELELRIIDVLNEKLKSITGKIFLYNKKLSREAETAVNKYYRGDDSLLRNSRFNILAYQSADPLNIPDEYIDFFISNRKKSQIGIKLLRPEENGIFKNYFLLAFVLRK